MCNLCGIYVFMYKSRCVCTVFMYVYVCWVGCVVCSVCCVLYVRVSKSYFSEDGGWSEGLCAWLGLGGVAATCVNSF